MSEDEVKELLSEEEKKRLFEKQKQEILEHINVVNEELNNLSKSNMLFDSDIKNLERKEKDIINIKEKDVVLENDIRKIRRDAKILFVVILLAGLIISLIVFFSNYHLSLALFVKDVLIIGAPASLAFALLVFFGVYFGIDFNKITYFKSVGLEINKKRKKIIIPKEKIKRVYLKGHLYDVLIKSDEYKELAARNDVKVIYSDSDNQSIIGKSMTIHLYIEYYNKKNKVEILNFDVQDTDSSQIKEFLLLFEI